MHYGMPTLLEFETLEENIALAKELGLQFVEINCNVPEFQVDRLNAKHLNQLSKESGIYFTFHLDEFLSVTDPNTKISEAYIQSVVDSIEFAKTANIPNLTMHFLNGVLFTLPTKKVYVYEKYRAEYHERLMYFRNRIEQAIQDAPIKLCIENVAGFVPHMQEAIDLLLESSAFGLTYDCGHNHRYEKVDDAFMKAHRNRINHAHLHDTMGKNDHLPFGEGEIDIMSEINFIKRNDPRIVIEIKTSEALRKAVPVLRQMLNSN